MRSTRARLFAVVTAVLVVGAAALFAWFQNAPEEEAIVAATAPVAPVAEVPTAAPVEAAQVAAPAIATPASVDLPIAERGRAIYAAATCAACHAIAGQGNPRNPLDGVGARLSPERIRQFTIGAPEVAAELPPGPMAAKQRYAQMPAADLEALVAYLVTMR